MDDADSKILAVAVASAVPMTTSLAIIRDVQQRQL